VGVRDRDGTPIKPTVDQKSRCSDRHSREKGNIDLGNNSFSKQKISTLLHTHTHTHTVILICLLYTLYFMHTQRVTFLNAHKGERNPADDSSDDDYPLTNDTDSNPRPVLRRRACRGVNGPSANDNRQDPKTRRR